MLTPMTYDYYQAIERAKWFSGVRTRTPQRIEIRNRRFLQVFHSQARGEIGNRPCLQPSRSKTKCTHWCPKSRSKASLTQLPEHVALLCFTFLTNGDLWRSANTCKLFYKAFFTLTKGGGRKLVKLASLGHRFPRVEVLNLQNPPRSKSEMRSLGQLKFPSLRALRVCYVWVQLLPQHQGVKTLHIVGCRVDSTVQFPYPNLTFLHIEDSLSKFSVANQLPHLLHLQKMVLSYCVVTHKLSAVQFPQLRCLKIKGFGVRFVLPELEELSLYLPPQKLHPQQQPNLRKLTVVTNGGTPILGRFTETVYPRLEILKINLGIQWQVLTLSALPYHQTLSHLRVTSCGRVNVGSVTREKFPSIAKVDIKADLVDHNGFPIDPVFRIS